MDGWMDGWIGRYRKIMQLF